ncbi:hypothetical protein [Methylocaldum szegediense]|nr:hypothetical protein [Methylocaldum szegediense]
MSDPTNSTQRELLSPEDISRSVEPPLKPVARDAGEPRIVDLTWFQFADHHGFERRLELGRVVNSKSIVLVSISEIGVFGGEWKPFQGAASAEVHNIVPHDDGTVIVRGYIGWERDINVRLSVLVA